MKTLSALCSALLALIALALPAPAARAGVPAITSELLLSGLVNPTFVTFAPGDPTRLYILEQRGVIRVAVNGVLQPLPFLDIDALVPNYPFGGLIGMAFDPDFVNNGFFYIHHSNPPGVSFNGTRIFIARYTITADPNVADAGSRHVILELPFTVTRGDHVGGSILFDFDGFMRLPLGDGTTTGTATAGAMSQSLMSLWGKTLRIDPSADAYPADPMRNYTPAPGNPFNGQTPFTEIWARGWRNPFRATIDRATGDFYCADVGLVSREEINFESVAHTGGNNYGWNCAEGNLCTTNANCNCVTDSLTFPVHEYPRADGCSITGGSVYRGCAIPGLEGRYFYSDWCSARVWSFELVGGAVTDVREHTASLNPGGGQPGISSVVAISEDFYGELHVCDNSAGRVFKIVPAGGILDDNMNGVADQCEQAACPWDLNGDGFVGAPDLASLLGAWNAPFTAMDLAALLGSWGPCP